MSHHGNEIFEQINNEHLKSFEESLQQTWPPLGATGLFPDGKINEHDEGELQFGMTISEGKLIMNFGKPIAWIGFEKKQVNEIIDYLTEKVKEM